jgi:glycosyltransferase involved in cell wall biosynthesis
MITSEHCPTGLAVLIATRNRPALLRERALASVAAQDVRPDLVAIVNDGSPWSSGEIDDIKSRLPCVTVLCAQNNRSPGVGGAWNTGLALLRDDGRTELVAIIDDDDLWDAGHLRTNRDAASTHGANIVVSGLRIRSSDGELPRPLLTRLYDRDYLTGNPGWQGTNTFVGLDLILSAGGFRESLRCMHDRDLAIQLLRHPDARPLLIPRWTATWCIDLPGRLSDRRGSAKLEGLRTFWAIYAGEMTNAEQHAFLARAETLFGFLPDEIVEPRDGMGPLCTDRMES